MSSPHVIDLAAEGRPGVHLQIAPDGNESTLNVMLQNSALPSSDFTGDTFAAAVSDDDGNQVALTISSTTYDAESDKTLIEIQFPADAIPESGKFGLSWTDTTGTKRWPVSGSYKRKALIQ